MFFQTPTVILPLFLLLQSINGICTPPKKSRLDEAVLELQFQVETVLHNWGSKALMMNWKSSYLEILLRSPSKEGFL